MKKTAAIFLPALFVLILTGLLSAATVDNPKPVAASSEIRTIAIMPFLAGKFHTDIQGIVEGTISCTVGQLCFEPEDMKLSSQKKLTEMVRDYIGPHLEPGSLVQNSRVAEAFEKMSGDIHSETLRNLAKRLGREVDADYVLVGTVWRYRDRSEDTDEFQKPAAVAFVTYLVETATGKMFWQGHYDQSQRALSEDLTDASLFFKSGMKWLTADEIASIGVREVYGKFPFSLSSGEKAFKP